MPNMKQKITNHNIKILKGENDRQTDNGCNCSGMMGPCPLEGNCLVKSVVYRAKATEDKSNFET